MNNLFEPDYRALVTRVIQTGDLRPSRVGETKSIFAAALKIRDLNYGNFPLVTSRRMFYRPVLGELAAFLRGATTLQEFKDLGCNYWDANAAAWSTNEGLLEKSDWSVGRIYGVQWRDWNRKHDQLRELVKNIDTDPFSRRHILSAWNPSEFSEMCLPPCHILAQFSVSNDGVLDCIVTMRSVDLCLGLPSDIVLYAALLILLAQTCHLQPGNLTFMLGDTHVYTNHEALWWQQESKPTYDLPAWTLAPEPTVFNFHPDMLQLSTNISGPVISYALNA